MSRIPILLVLLASRVFCGLNCGGCHARQAMQWAKSAHARALRPIVQSDFLSALPDRPIGEARGGYLLEFASAGNALKVTSARGSDSASALIEWIFGAGRRAETPVASNHGQYIELRISYYRTDGRFDLTLGHQPGASRSAQQAIGMTQDAESIRRCFGCHSTGGMPGDKQFSAGVGCAACHPAAVSGPHPPGAPLNHVQLSNQALLKRREATAICEQCHRSEPEGNSDDPINVRYQAVRLRRSRCFSAGALSCITCHNPHESASTDAEWYRGRCLLCHPQQTSMGNCVECHMPSTAINARLTFTDHWIRVQR